MPTVIEWHTDESANATVTVVTPHPCPLFVAWVELNSLRIKGTEMMNSVALSSHPQATPLTLISHLENTFLWSLGESGKSGGWSPMNSFIVTTVENKSRAPTWRILSRRMESCNIFLLT